MVKLGFSIAVPWFNHGVIVGSVLELMYTNEFRQVSGSR